MTKRYKWNKAWRYKYPAKRHQSSRRYYRKHRENPANRRNSRAAWKPKEIALIIAPKHPPDPVLAKKLGRSVQAIQLKRMRVRAATKKAKHRRRNRSA